MTKAMMLDMDDARKARFKKVCDAIIDLCHRELEGPAEAYAVVSLVKESFEDTWGFTRSIPFKTEGVWAISVLKDREAGDPKVVNKAIFHAPHFRATVNAAIQSALEFEEGTERGQRRGCGMLVSMCLVIGWKLAEMKMAQIAGVAKEQ